jgi:proteasome lid subunit RPN8/RPN11
MTETIHIPQHFYAEMVAHAREGFPNEVCGVILGAQGQLRELHRVANAAADPLYTYDMEPRALLKLNQRADEAGLAFAVIYHSHPPFAEVYPSATDIAKAFYPDAIYIILAIGQVSRQLRDDLRDPTKRASIVATWGDPQTMTPRMRAYRITKEDWLSKEGKVAELTIEVMG